MRGLGLLALGWGITLGACARTERLLPVAASDAGVDAATPKSPSVRPPAAPAAQPCTPLTCAGHTCGAEQDGCGGLLECGTCPEGQRCEYAAVRRCVPCVPLRCEDFVEGVCGEVPDGCGGSLSCGEDCADGEVCGGDAWANWCAPPLEVAGCVGMRRDVPFDLVSGNVRGVRECTPGGWCTSNGHMEAGIEDLWGFSERDVWAVSGGAHRAVVLHWDGTAWTRVPVPTEERLRGVWGAAPDDVWAVGRRGTVLRWDGASWRRVAVPTDVDLTAVHGTSARSVYLVGPDAALHWDGTGFQAMPGWVVASARLGERAWEHTGLWALRDDDVVSVGPIGCQRWDGLRWSEAACGARGSGDVWASGSDDVWVVTAYSGAFARFTNRVHWDGTRWTREAWSSDRSDDYEDLRTVFGFARDDVWIGTNWHWDGKRWQRACRSGEPSALWGASPGRLFAGREWLADFDGRGWRRTARLGFLFPAFGRGPATAPWGVSSYGEVFGRTDAGWQGLGGSTNGYHDGAFGSSAQDVWSAPGEWQLMHWDGTRWQSGGLWAPTGSGWATGPDSAFVLGSFDVGNSVHLWRWDGVRWSHVDVNWGGDKLRSFWASGPNDVWAIADSAETPDLPLGGTALWHWNGRDWVRLHREPGVYAVSLFGTGPENVWVLAGAGSSNRTLHAFRWDGRSLVRVGTFEGHAGREFLAGTGPGDMWVASGLTPDWGTRLYHYDGTHWTEESPLPGELWSLWSVPGSATYAASRWGVLWEHPAR